MTTPPLLSPSSISSVITPSPHVVIVLRNSCQVWEPVLSMPKSKRKQLLEPIQSKSLERPWPIGIAPQHSKVPVRKYFPMTNPLSSLGGGTFNAKIKEKTVIRTHPEQKFEASLATWHCRPTLKSPHTKIPPYYKSLVKSKSWYFQWGKSK